MVKLALTEFGGDGDLPTLVLLHGLLGTSRNLTTIARGFTASRRVIGFDMRNHGASPWVDTHSYPELAEDVAESLADLDGSFDLLGHSMGGKAAMVGVLTGLLHPRKLIVGDIAPIGYTHTQAPMIELMQSVDLNSFDRRGPLARHFGEALSDPITGQFLAQAAVFDDGPRWLHNLDVLNAEMAKIVGFPNVESTSDIPALFVAGGASDYVDHLAVSQKFKNAQIQEIAGAGHWVHAENPKRFNEIVASFLDT